MRVTMYLGAVGPRLPIAKVSAGQHLIAGPIFCQHLAEDEMSNTDLSDLQLLNDAKAALRDKDKHRAAALWAEFCERSVARVKAKVANDLT